MSTDNNRAPEQTGLLDRHAKRWAEAVKFVDEGKARPQTVEVVELLRQGLTTKEAAEHLGLERSAIYQRLRDPTPKWTTASRLKRYAEAVKLVDEGKARPQVVEAVELLRQGFTVEEIAKRLGIAKNTAYQRFTDPTDERNIARKRRNYRPCLNCGQPMYPYNGASLCASCHLEDVHERSVAWLVAEIRYWHELYGRPPTATEWTPAPSVKCRISPERWREIERRHREDGPWPWVGVVVHTFGSWSAAIAAAGFSPLRPGERYDTRLTAQSALEPA